MSRNEKDLNLTARLILLMTIAVTVTDLIEFYHLKRRPEHLTLPFAIQVIVVVVVPIGIIILYRYKRKWL
ncbi:MAG: hypothetical protein P8Y60_17825 [Calditrichota bacterium]